MRVLTYKKKMELTDAAGRAFLKHGFGATTIGMIAEEGTASKSTFYRYFKSKEDVFAAFVVRAGEEHTAQINLPFEMKNSVGESLIALGHQYLSIILAPSIVAVNRLVIGEANRFPQLAEIYFENGPREVISFIETTLKAMTETGWIELTDPHQAAWYFKSICEVRFHERVLWGFRDELSPKEIETHLEQAIPLFLNLAKGQL